jgi:acylphosphatase
MQMVVETDSVLVSPGSERNEETAMNCSRVLQSRSQQTHRTRDLLGQMEASPSLCHCRARVYGLVQGVFYRASTQEKATQLGVAGWVRNCADGSVELEAFGTTTKVEELLAWCRRGPELARVDRVDIEWLPPPQHPDEWRQWNPFRVVR